MQTIHFRHLGYIMIAHSAEVHGSAAELAAEAVGRMDV